MTGYLKRCNAASGEFEEFLATLLQWELREDPELVEQVRDIVDTVRTGGDPELLKYTEKFDGVSASQIDELHLDRKELSAAWNSISPQQREALDLAAGRIRRFHTAQVEREFEITDSQGNVVGQRITPLSRVGVYVPGGTAAYPSTVLMTVLPAKVAQVENIIVTVPTPRGIKNKLLLAALHVCEPDEILQIGGAQAIAALAYGTESIDRVDKIVGPGGSWVAAAKKLVFGPVGIDSIAGPSEILIIADGSVPARWTALDLLSQAEHDASAQAILISTTESYLKQVDEEIEKLVVQFPRREIIVESLCNRGASILVKSLDQAVKIANRVAPEHLQLSVANPHALLNQVKNAGAIFLGASSSEVLGDYVAGPSHVLPTFGTARYASPLGVHDFVKRTSTIEMVPTGVDQLCRMASVMAESEGLHAHAAAARARIPGLDHNVDGT